MLTGTRLYPGEARARFREDEWTRCPDVAVRDPWLVDLVELWNYSQDGRGLRDIEPHPSASVFSGFAVLQHEIRDREAAAAERAAAARKAEAAAPAPSRRRGGG